MNKKYWQDIEHRISTQETFILTEDERKKIHKDEQQAFESNLEILNEIMNEFQKNLTDRGFSITETRLEKNGFIFKYVKVGYYGPAGFRTDFHLDGPLVLSQLTPQGDPNTFITYNDLDKNFEIGRGFNIEKFKRFLEKNLNTFLDPANLITTEERREQLRALQNNK
ncbi:MAG: hypothetical protein JRE64_21735 [Deltaproteobacteria bacterium]|nr:hypothetical protein [Deltaproteobacteria bacterium]